MKGCEAYLFYKHVVINGLELARTSRKLSAGLFPIDIYSIGLLAITYTLFRMRLHCRLMFFLEPSLNQALSMSEFSRSMMVSETS